MKTPLVRAIAICAVAMAASLAPARAQDLINEKFEGASFPPSGWANTGCTSVQNPQPYHSYQHSILIDSRSDALRTPLLSSPGALTFWLYTPDQTKTLVVQSSSNPGGPWTEISESPFSTTGPNVWTSEVADLTSFSNIYLQFKINSQTEDFSLYIDDVVVTGSGAVPTPTPTPGATATPGPSQGFSFLVDQVIGNRIQNFTAPFNDVTVLNQVLEVTEGFSKGSRFFIYDFNATTLFCTGLLNNYPVNLEAAGVHPGDQCSVLSIEQVWPLNNALRTAVNTLQDTSSAPTWETDQFKGFYVYLNGLVDGAAVRSFFSITNNTIDTFSVDGTLSGLPAYSGTVEYLIVTNPPSPQTKPIVRLGTNAHIDPLCDICTLRGITYTLIPLPNSPQWNPLNEVDPYVAVNLPTGQLLFFHHGRWSSEVRPVYRSLILGDESSGVLGVFMMGPGLPTGRYTIYSVLQTPGASVFNTRYWRSDLTSTSFFFP